MNKQQSVVTKPLLAFIAVSWLTVGGIVGYNMERPQKTSQSCVDAFTKQDATFASLGESFKNVWTNTPEQTAAATAQLDTDIKEMATLRAQCLSN